MGCGERKRLARAFLRLSRESAGLWQPESGMGGIKGTEKREREIAWCSREWFGWQRA